MSISASSGYRGMPTSNQSSHVIKRFPYSIYLINNECVFKIWDSNKKKFFKKYSTFFTIEYTDAVVRQNGKVRVITTINVGPTTTLMNKMIKLYAKKNRLSKEEIRELCSHHLAVRTMITKAKQLYRTTRHTLDAVKNCSVEKKPLSETSEYKNTYREVAVLRNAVQTITEKNYRNFDELSKKITSHMENTAKTRPLRKPLFASNPSSYEKYILPPSVSWQRKTKWTRAKTIKNAAQTIKKITLEKSEYKTIQSAISHAQILSPSPKQKQLPKISPKEKRRQNTYVKDHTPLASIPE